MRESTSEDAVLFIFGDDPVNIISTLKRSSRILGVVTCAVITLMASHGPALAQQNARPAAVRPASPAQVDFKLSDARNIEPNSVRFSAAQFTRESLTVVLFGASDASWEKLKTAVQRSIFAGYPVRMVFIGPSNEPRAIEVYAKGHHVTNPIDPETISVTELTALLRDVSREYYPRKR